MCCVLTCTVLVCLHSWVALESEREKASSAERQGLVYRSKPREGRFCRVVVIGILPGKEIRRPLRLTELGTVVCYDAVGDGKICVLM